MTKEAYIYFLFLLHFFGYQSLAEEIKSADHEKARYSKFSPYLKNRVKSKIEFLLVKKNKNRIKTIIRADQAKWREYLSRLLGHRHTPYTYPSFECELSTVFYCFSAAKVGKSNLLTTLNLRRLVTLPGYYDFLHRLCAF